MPDEHSDERPNAQSWRVKVREEILKATIFALHGFRTRYNKRAYQCVPEGFREPRKIFFGNRKCFFCLNQLKSFRLDPRSTHEALLFTS